MPEAEGDAKPERLSLARQQAQLKDFIRSQRERWEADIRALRGRLRAAATRNSHLIPPSAQAALEKRLAAAEEALRGARAEASQKTRELAETRAELERWKSRAEELWHRILNLESQLAAPSEDTPSPTPE